MGMNVKMWLKIDRNFYRSWKIMRLILLISKLIDQGKRRNILLIVKWEDSINDLLLWSHIMRTFFQLMMRDNKLGFIMKMLFFAKKKGKDIIMSDFLLSFSWLNLLSLSKKDQNQLEISEIPSEAVVYYKYGQEKGY